MSDETKIDYDKIERYLLPHERCILPSYPGIWVKDILTIVRDARQLTAERERVRELAEACQSLVVGLRGIQHNTNSAQDARMVAGDIIHHAMHEWPSAFPDPKDEAQRKTDYAPNNPCPDCGATERVHTCPNWRESTDLREKLMEFGAAIVTGKTRSLDVGVPDVAREFVDAILAAIDARLARNK